MRPNVVVTLRPGYLARHVALVVRRTGYKSRRWTLYGRDSVSCLHPVTVDGVPALTFKTQRDAVAYLTAIEAAGVDVTRIWAEPRETAFRTYVAPARDGGHSIHVVTRFA